MLLNILYIYIYIKKKSLYIKYYIKFFWGAGCWGDGGSFVFVITFLMWIKTNNGIHYFDLKFKKSFGTWFSDTNFQNNESLFFFCSIKQKRHHGICLSISKFRHISSINYITCKIVCDLSPQTYDALI